MNRRATALFVAGLLGLLLLASILALLRRQPAPGPLTPLVMVSFAGFTNAADGQRFAQIVLSNLTETTVLISQPGTIVRANGQWSMLAAATQPVLLGARQQRLMSIQRPTDVEAWRMATWHGALPSRLAHGALRVWRVLPCKPQFLDVKMERAGTINMRLAESEIRTD